MACVDIIKIDSLSKDCMLCRYGFKTIEFDYGKKQD